MLKCLARNPERQEYWLMQGGTYITIIVFNVNWPGIDPLTPATKVDALPLQNHGG